MKKKIKTLLPLNLQFFAEEDNNSGNKDSSTKNNDNPENDNKDDGNKEDQANSGGKTFTQEEVTRMMAKEKKEGRNAAIKALGFTNEEEAKKAADLLKALLDSQKSESEKEKENNQKKKTDKEEAEQRANNAEAKLSCFLAGVNKDSIDDVLSIAMTKVDDNNDLSKVLEEMKKNKRYSSFFGGSSEEDGGTGNPPGHSKDNKNSEKGSYGKRLATANTSDKKKESNYF